VDLAKKWLKRHKAEYSKIVKNDPPRAISSKVPIEELDFEDDEYSFVIIPRKYHSPALKVSVNISEKSSKRHVGRLYIDIENSGTGSRCSFEFNPTTRIYE
jgi:hypothetical protein